MKIIAHRGASGDYPENTMAAFKAAYRSDAYGIELDVQLSKDGEVVVIHDETLDRTTNAHGFVRDYTLNELKELDASKVKDGWNKKELIPSFDEYCNWVKDTNLITNIEIKSGVYYYEGLEEKTLEIVKKYKLEEKVIFSSFNPLSVVKIKQLDKNIKCGLLTENGGILNAGPLCHDFGFEYYHPSKDDLTKENIISCNKFGIGLNVWTVNDFESFSFLSRENVNAIITNYPSLASKFM